MIHPVVGEVTCVQSPRARRISISVRGSSGAVRLTYPRGVSQTQALAFLEQKTAWIEHTRRRLASKTSAEPPLPASEAKAYVEQLRRQGKEYLPGRVAYWMSVTGLRCGKVTVRAARTKWGSCSGRNDISLSLFLMTLPEHLRDYVIVHELCHTVHHNHSPRFHALVDKHLAGRGASLRRELRGYAIRG